MQSPSKLRFASRLILAISAISLVAGSTGLPGASRGDQLMQGSCANPALPTNGIVKSAVQAAALQPVVDPPAGLCAPRVTSTRAGSPASYHHLRSLCHG